MKNIVVLSLLTLACSASAQLGGLKKLKEASQKVDKTVTPTKAGSSDASIPGAQEKEEAAQNAEKEFSTIKSSASWDYVNRLPIGYKEYVKMRDEYVSSRFKRDYGLKMIPDCDKYYSEWVPMVITKEVLPKIEGYQKTFEKDKKSNAEWAIRACKDALELINKYLTVKPEDAALEKHKATFQQQLTEEELYVSSGEYKKHQEAEKEKDIANERMPKAVASNPAWEKEAKSLVEASNSGGTVLKVALVDKEWYITKNELGIPLHRNKMIYVAYKSKSTNACYYTTVTVNQQYAGGGNYNEKVYFIDATSDKKTKIACENIDK